MNDEGMELPVVETRVYVFEFGIAQTLYESVEPSRNETLDQIKLSPAARGYPCVAAFLCSISCVSLFAPRARTFVSVEQRFRCFEAIFREQLVAPEYTRNAQMPHFTPRKVLKILNRPSIDA